MKSRRGNDVRDFILIGGGGAGPVHAAFLAELLGVRTVVIPQAAGLYSALGMQVMDIGREYARTYVSPAPTLNVQEVNALYAAMEEEALTAFRRMGLEPRDVHFGRSADMRYYRQFPEIPVPLPARPPTGDAGPPRAPGQGFRGPAIIEEATTTAVIPPGFEARVDAYHNYVLTREG